MSCPLPRPRDEALAGIVDLARYPQLDGGAAHETVVPFAAALARDGVCVLPGFLLPDAREALTADLERLRAAASRGPTAATAYYGAGAGDFPPGHPRTRLIPREMWELAYDQIPASSALHRLYGSETFLAFLAAMLGVDQLYRYDDPYQSITISLTPEGSGQNWHFDDTDFITTLMVQAPHDGGAFECRPNLRTPEDENYAGVTRILDGGRDGVRIIPFDEGALMIFQGLYALHQVTPVRGDRTRIVAVLSFDTRPGRRVPPGRNRELFGPRVEGA